MKIAFPNSNFSPQNTFPRHRSSAIRNSNIINLNLEMDQSSGNLPSEHQHVGGLHRRNSCCCCSTNDSNNGCGWWEPQQESLAVSFFRDSSLHGLKYIGQPKRHMLERMFWAIAFLASVVAAAYLINDLWLIYNTRPVIVSFQQTETKISAIPFPAVTICNVNNIKKSKVFDSETGFIDQAEGLAASERTEAQIQRNYLDFVCQTAASFSQKLSFGTELWPVTNESSAEAPANTTGNQTFNEIADFLQKYSQNCNEMIRKCFWEDVEVNCSEIFIPFQTDFGKCCTFNMVPEKLLNVFRSQIETRDPNITKAREDEWSKSELNVQDLLLDSLNLNLSETNYPARVKGSGKTYGLSILLNPDLDDYLCTTADSTGFQVVTHLSTEIPRVVDFGLAVMPNAETFIRVLPDVTTAEPEIYQIDLSQRSCYFKNEYFLKFYKIYSNSNCMDECFVNWTRTMCNCVRYFMPRDHETAICGIENYNCTKAAKADFINHSNNGSCSHCLPTCTEINYSTETTVSPIRSDTKTWLNSSQQPADWAYKNVSILHVYFGQDSTYAKVRRKMYGTTDLIAYTGGVLGLCMGFSGISLLEIIYFLTIRVYYKYCRSEQSQESNTISRNHNQLQKNMNMWNRAPVAGGNGSELLKMRIIINQPSSAADITKKLEIHNSLDGNYFFGELATSFQKPRYSYVD